jgi:hypothetical protein
MADKVFAFLLSLLRFTEVVRQKLITNRITYPIRAASFELRPHLQPLYKFL